jgi:hypothetical protein
VADAQYIRVLLPPSNQAKGRGAGRPAAGGEPAPYFAMSIYSIVLGGKLAAEAYDLDSFCDLGVTLRQEWSEDGQEDALIRKFQTHMRDQKCAAYHCF